ncbi:hypothetical protein [Streptosporangium sp. V21-05]
MRPSTGSPTRLTRHVGFVKRVVPTHDDPFDFCRRALPGRGRVPLDR